MRWKRRRSSRTRRRSVSPCGPPGEAGDLVGDHENERVKARLAETREYRRRLQEQTENEWQVSQEKRDLRDRIIYDLDYPQKRFLRSFRMKS